MNGEYDQNGYMDDLPFDAEAESDGGDDEGEATGGGDSKSPRKYRVMIEPFLDFADDPTLSEEENVERKLRLLSISPISILVPGASSFASENDLSRKIFMAEVGRANGEMSGRAIADPDIISKLDARMNERRTLFGLPRPSMILAGGAALAQIVVAAFTGMIAKAPKKSDPAVKAGQTDPKRKAKLLDFSLGKESAFGAAPDDKLAAKGANHKPDLDASAVDILSHATIETVAAPDARPHTALDFDSLSSFFNFLSERAKSPVLTVRIKEGGKSGSQVEGPATPWQEYNPIR